MEDDSSQHDENSNESDDSPAAPSETDKMNNKDVEIKREAGFSEPKIDQMTTEGIKRGRDAVVKVKGENGVENRDNIRLNDSAEHEKDEVESSQCDESEFSMEFKEIDGTSEFSTPSKELDDTIELSTSKKQDDTVKSDGNELLTEQEDDDSNNASRDKKRALRKTTISLRDSLLYREDGAFFDEEGKEEEPELPPKRRRKKARPRSASLGSEVSEMQPSDLELGYKILEQIMVFPSATPFLDKPDENAYGMKDYYDIIKSPIWLKGIDRKYRDEEYTSVTELIRDIRYVFENCYQYWGAGDPLSKKALRVEEFLEKKISSLPLSVKQLCSLDLTHGEVPGEDDVEDDSNKDDQQTPEAKRYCQMIKKSNFASKLLRRVITAKKSDSSSLSSPAHIEIEEIEQEVEDWENTSLLIGDVLTQISAMWELPVIGHFFYLTFNVLNIEPISQLELERMLLMPQASRMLAKVMTTMLIPPLSRAKLEVGPPMPYCIWTAKLKTKVSLWYRIYRAAGDQTLKVFEQIGVEPEFWLVMGENNPFKDSEFHELSFLQRVWLLKSLCDYLLHNHKTIQDVINNIEPEELREKCLGKDKAGYTYHYFPEFSEVRIYKQAKVTESKWKKFEAGVEEVISEAAEDVEYGLESEDHSLLTQAAGIKKFLHKPPRNMLPCAENFKLVAASVEDVRCLIDEFCKADLQVLQGRGPTAPLVLRLNAIVSELEPIERKLISSITYIRKKMHKEWTDYKNRDPDYVDPGIAYWERREKDHPEKEEKSIPTPAAEASGESSTFDQPYSERRERRSKRESQMRYMNMDIDRCENSDEEDEEYYEEDEDSEDEWTACPSKKKKKSTGANKRMKKLNSLTEQMKLQPEQQGIRRNNNNNSLVAFDGTKIKLENVKSEKNEFIKNEMNFNYTNPNPGIYIKQEPSTQNPVYPAVIKQEVNVPSQTVVRTLVKFSTPVQQFDKVPVKRSLSPDPNIVVISDEDPDSPPDVKPVLEDLRSIKTVDCVVPLVDQRDGPRPQFNQNQFLGQYSNSNNVSVPYTPGRDNQVYVNNMPYVAQVRGSPQQMVPTVRAPHNQNVMYPQNNISSPTLKQSLQSFVNNSKNVLPRNSSPQARTNQNYYMSPQNSKNSSPNNRSFVNNSSPQQMNKSPLPRQNFIRSPTVQQRSPRGSAPLQNMPSPRGPIIPSPGRGRPRMIQNIRMPSPAPRGGGVRQVSPQQMSKTLTNSPQLRQRSPSLISQRNMTPPQQRTPGSSFNSPASVNRFQNSKLVNQSLTPPARRNLNFNSPSRPARQEPPLQIVNTGNVQGKKVTTVEGKLVVGLTDDGSYGYHVVLSDGGRVNLTSTQLSELRAKNGGSLPQKVGVPMVQSSD